MRGLHRVDETRLDAHDDMGRGAQMAEARDRATASISASGYMLDERARELPGHGHGQDRGLLLGRRATA